LAAGPPLDAPPQQAAASPPLRQQSRPQESASAWANDVRNAGIPSEAEFAAALRGAPADRLGELARRYIAAAERLRARPDPKGQRERSAVLRLGLLVDADAARTTQAATFLQDGPQHDLTDVGRTIAGVGKDLVAEARP
jgi:hypothetical protein